MTSLRAFARVVLTGFALAVSLAGCGIVSMSPPAATPTDFGGIASLLSPQGVVVTHVVSGDAGCTDPDLVPTAIAFDATGLDQSTPVRIYLYVFRNKAAWERHRDAIPGCAAAFVTDPETFEQVEQSPYIVAGQGPWAADFEAALRRALEQGAGTGG
jgi:hypothetical protein